MHASSRVRLTMLERWISCRDDFAGNFQVKYFRLEQLWGAGTWYSLRPARSAKPPVVRPALSLPRRPEQCQRKNGDGDDPIPLVRKLTRFIERGRGELAKLATGSRRDCNLQHAVALVREQVVGFFDLVQRKAMRHHRAQVDPARTRSRPSAAASAPCRRGRASSRSDGRRAPPRKRPAEW